MTLPLWTTAFLMIAPKPVILEDISKPLAKSGRTAAFCDHVRGI